MKPKIKRIILIWGLLCIPSLMGVRGYGTEPLLKSVTVKDPWPIEYTRGYATEDRLYVEYYINNKYPTHKDKLPENWIDGAEKWHVEFYLDRIRNNNRISSGRKKEFVVHRKPLTENIVAAGKSVIVQKLERSIGTHDDVYRYIEVNAPKNIPSFYYREFQGIWHDIFLRIPDSESLGGYFSGSLAESVGKKIGIAG